MLFNLNEDLELQVFRVKAYDAIQQKKTIEFKVKKNTRSLQQNKALHKFFGLISDKLNEMGIEFVYTGLKGNELRMQYTPDIVKDFFWRPIQKTLFDIDSTTEINTKQMNEVVDVITLFFADKGVVIEFPSIDNINYDKDR